MFTGIIQATGRIETIEPKGSDSRLRVATGRLDLSSARLGDSIAVNGVCLTAVEIGAAAFAADVSGETLSCTTLGDLKPGDEVDLEKALTLATPLGGHLVSGHVDGVGEVRERRDDGRSVRFTIRVPDPLARYIAAKGSVCVDGVSLTVNTVDGATFTVNIVPHTLSETVIRHYRPGARVNIEVDVIARYLERLILGEAAARLGTSITESFLAEHGFLG